RLAVLYALIVAYAASVVLFYVFARYRYPLVPLLIPFAAAGGIGIWDLGFGIRSGFGTRIPNPNRIPNPKSLIPIVIVVAVFTNWPI
ncbi:MAG: hypothetical protein DMG00_15475, partial [Acidobacteria bacterium]